MLNSVQQFEIDVRPSAVQHLVPQNKAERYEGVSFSVSGQALAIATADTNSILLFRKAPDGRFEAKPYARLDATSSGLNYPHDVAFSEWGNTDLLAVAQRRGAIAVYAKSRPEESFGAKPVFEISGSEAKLEYSDGVAFVPPKNDYLAACNLVLGTVCFYRRASRSPIRFNTTPEFELKHESIFHPDGLAFSACGSWLATANHGAHSVSVFRRRNRLLARGRPVYGPEPVSVIKDPGMRYPHSVAFTPRTNHLVVTNAGANYFSVYQAKRNRFGLRWPQSPLLSVNVNDDAAFKAINETNNMEGGPKGIAAHRNEIAVCSPEFGVKIYSFHDAA